VGKDHGRRRGDAAFRATLLKFMVVGLALSAFWSDFWSGGLLGRSILIQLLRFTLANSLRWLQPAAAKLKGRRLLTGLVTGLW
jgi:hypothetical protein